MNSTSEIKMTRLIAKILVFLILINIGCFLISYLPIGKLSLYNWIFPGRLRLPFGENPTKSYNLTINNLDAMIASHEIAGTPKNERKFRVFLIGDSSIWGFLQQPADTLAEILKHKNLQRGNREVEIFNLGYPSLSVFKDVLVLEKTLKFQPDLVIWFVTLESLNNNEQLSTPLVSNNWSAVNQVIQKYDLDFDFREDDIFERTLIKQRRNLADLLRLQLFGVMWAATGIDQEYPESIIPALRDFENDPTYKGYTGLKITKDDLALEIIKQVIRKNRLTDFVVVNEPILIAQGTNSDIRYNFYYPRWAFDQYREIFKSFAEDNGIKYCDLWNSIPENLFTNSAIHLNKEGELLLADKICGIIEDQCEKND